MPRHELVLYRKDGEIVRISDTIDPMNGWRRSLVIDAEWEPVENFLDEHSDAIFTIAMFVCVATPFAALLHLACVKGWI